MPYTAPRETLAAAAFLPIFKALVAHVVLAHPCVAFHPCTCGLCGGAVAVTAVLIDYFLNTDAWLCWIATLTLLLLLNVSSGNGDLWPLYLQVSYNGRCNASVAYPLPYSGIRAILRSFWFRSFAARFWLDQSGLKRGGSWLCHVTEWLVCVLPLLYAWHVPTGWNHHQD
jgi:hypothetical protein